MHLSSVPNTAVQNAKRTPRLVSNETGGGYILLSAFQADNNESMHAIRPHPHHSSSPLTNHLRTSQPQTEHLTDRSTARSPPPPFIPSLPTQHPRQQRPKLHPPHIPPPLLARAPPQPHLPVAEQVRPPLADAVLFLAELPGTLGPVALAQAQFVQDERHERAVVVRGPFRLAVSVVLVVILPLTLERMLPW